MAQCCHGNTFKFATHCAPHTPRRASTLPRSHPSTLRSCVQPCAWTGDCGKTASGADCGGKCIAAPAAVAPATRRLSIAPAAANASALACPLLASAVLAAADAPLVGRRRLAALTAGALEVIVMVDASTGRGVPRTLTQLGPLPGALSGVSLKLATECPTAAQIGAVASIPALLALAVPALTRRGLDTQTVSDLSAHHACAVHPRPLCGRPLAIS
jgi:hypothetical protein